MWWEDLQTICSVCFLGRQIHSYIPPSLEYICTRQILVSREKECVRGERVWVYKNQDTTAETNRFLPEW
jgi:hypothetical protein